MPVSLIVILLLLGSNCLQTDIHLETSMSGAISNLPPMEEKQASLDRKVESRPVKANEKKTKKPDWQHRKVEAWPFNAKGGTQDFWRISKSAPATC